MKRIALYLLTLAWSAYGYEYPDEFELRQQASMRTFHIMREDQFLGAVFNSAYGQFDFYDGNREKICVNSLDTLYDLSHRFLGFIEWRNETSSGFWHWLLGYPKTHMLLYSGPRTPLLTLDEEGAGNGCVFRDYFTRKPLAIALYYPTTLKKNVPTQNWRVFIVDRCLLEERGISPVFLTWALLKKSQLRFPSPDQFPYERALEDFCSHRGQL